MCFNWNQKKKVMIIWWWKTIVNIYFQPGQENPSNSSWTPTLLFPMVMEVVFSIITVQDLRTIPLSAGQFSWYALATTHVQLEGGLS